MTELLRRASKLTVLLAGLTAASPASADPASEARSETQASGEAAGRLAPPLTAKAERTLHLDEALALARTKNRDLGAARATLEISDAAVEQAWAALLPVVSAQGKYTHNYKEIVIPLPAQLAPSGPPTVQRSDQLDGVLAATVPLVAPPAYSALSAARRAREAAGASYDATLATVELRVAQTFYGAASADELAKVRRHGIAVAKETLDNASARFANGVVNRVEVTRAELAMVRAEQAAVDAEEVRDQAYRALQTVLDLHEDLRVDPTARELGTTAVTPESKATALRERPEIVALSKQLEATEAQGDAALWRWAPTLSAFGNARIANYAGFSGDKYAWAVGAQLDWVLYDAGARDAQRHQAHAQAKQAEAQLAQLRDTVSDEIANAEGSVKTRLRALETARHSVDLSTETLALVRAQHDAGTATQIDLLQAQDALIAAEVQLAQARFELTLATLTLDRALGVFPPKQP